MDEPEETENESHSHVQVSTPALVRVGELRARRAPNSHMGGPLFGRIKFLDQNRGRKVYISQAHQWVDFSRSWFLGDGPWCCSNALFHEFDHRSSPSLHSP